MLLLFSLVALGQLALALAALTLLLRYRSLVPLIFALLLAEHIARRAIIIAWSGGSWFGASPAMVINLGLSAMLVAGLILSLWPRRTHE